MHKRILRFWSHNIWLESKFCYEGKKVSVRPGKEMTLAGAITTSKP